jgi:seryl-tRNA synthetase
MANRNIIVNGYRANVVMLDNAPIAGRRFAIARLPEAAAVTGGFITFMVTSRTSQGYTQAVPLKIVLNSI